MDPSVPMTHRDSVPMTLTGPDGSTEVQLKEPGSVLVSFQFMHITNTQLTCV